MTDTNCDGCMKREHRLEDVNEDAHDLMSGSYVLNVCLKRTGMRIQKYGRRTVRTVLV